MMLIGFDGMDAQFRQLLKTLFSSPGVHAWESKDDNSHASFRSLSGKPRSGEMSIEG